MKKMHVQRAVAMLVVLVLTLGMAVSALAAYKTIPFGEQGDDVRVMQTALKKKGYYKGSVDGKFGPETRKAVYRYQSSLGIKADGKPGNKTLTALYDGGSTAINTIDGRKANSYTPKDPHSLYYGCTGQRVRYLQKALKAAGYFSGTVDGKYGELTELAVRKFQTKRGLKTDGIAGVKTLNSLNRAQSKVKLRTSFVLAYGSRGDEVKTVQRALSAFYPGGDGDPMGIYGESTEQMVKNWQRATGKEATGTITEKQYNAIVTSK